MTPLRSLWLRRFRFCPGGTAEGAVAGLEGRGPGPRRAAWTISNAPRPSTWAPGYVPPVEDFADAVLAQVRNQTERGLAEYPM